MRQFCAIVLVLVGLLRCSDGKPTFTQGDVALLDRMTNVKEDQSPNQALGSLFCQDLDAAGRVSITLQDGDEFVRISGAGRDQITVYIESARAIDYELTVVDRNQQNEKSVTIECKNIVTEQATVLELKLVIKDVNDNEPIFQRTNKTYQTRINEILLGPVPEPIYVGEIEVTDIDGVDNNKIEAECIGIEVGSRTENCTGFFSVQEVQTGSGSYVFNVFAERLDYSGFTAFTLIIRAKNVPTNTQDEETMYSITQNVVININDIQNLPPNIDKDTLSFVMSEDRPPNSDVEENKKIRAFDQDVGDPNAIRFELARNDQDPYAFDNNLFELGTVYPPLTGEKEFSVDFKLNNSIDREKIENNIKSVQIDIIAIEYDPQNRPDRNPQTARATVIVRISDVNDKRPEFNQNNYRVDFTELSNIAVPENFRQLASDVEIKVADNDSSQYNNFNVRFISGNFNGDFSLRGKTNGSQSETFIIYAKEKILDYEIPPNQYQLVIEATDQGRPDLSSTAVVDIYIIDANDHSPEFTTGSIDFSVNEDEQPGTIIGTIQATDRDSGDFGTISRYEILDSSETFSIDNNGRIMLMKALDFDNIRERYSFSAIAYDGGVGKNQRDGTIFVNVLVQNVFDVGPIFLDSVSYSAQLFEESLDLIPALTIQAENREQGTNTQIIYSIQKVEPAGLRSSFQVNSFSGEVTVTQFVNHKATSNGTVFITFEASAGGLSTTKQGTVSVIDINNYPPVFQNIGPNNVFQAYVSELARTNDVVIQLAVLDADGPDTLNGIVEFQIQSGANDDFVIRQDSGEILVVANATLDYDETKQYNITVVARDKGNPIKSATATVRVDVIDANNKKPIFDNVYYVLRMNEGDAVNTAVGNVSARDQDVNGVIRYEILYNTAQFQKNTDSITQFVNASLVIKIDDVTGIIRVAGPIDRSAYDFMSFKVLARDVNITTTQAAQTATASVVIYINADIDDRIYFEPPWTRTNPFIIKPYTETNSFNYRILTLKATDPSKSKTITNYREVPNTDAGDYFEVKDRQVSIKKPLDYEILGPEKQISVVVEAISDDNMRTATATIIVNVRDLNDNAPEFERSEYTFKVPEDKTYTFQVGSVKATDKDSVSYGDVEYYLAGSNNEDFAIYRQRQGNEQVAVIIVSETAKLDYEVLPEYNLQLIAQDNPTSSPSSNNIQFRTSVPVRIVIEDRNDIIPLFDDDLYEFSIIGTKEIGGEVGFVYAIDEDSGRNGQVTYSFLSGTADALIYFGIRTIDLISSRPGDVLKQGQVYVKRSLEALADRTVFELIVEARDDGQPPLPPGNSRVRITVSKGVQDLKPKWDENLPSKVQIPEHSPLGSNVTRVRAFPANASSHIEYSFLGAGDALKDYENFNIDKYSGQITVRKDLDFETKNIFNLQILATDSANATLTNQFLLIVEVLDIDDNTPAFNTCLDKTYPKPVLTSVLEDVPEPLFVYQVQACDNDQYPYNEIWYEWFFDDNQNSADTLCKTEITNFFTLDKTTGNIYTKTRLDRETNPEFLLCIEAMAPTGTANGRRRRDALEDALEARTNHDKVLYVKVIVIDVNDMGPNFTSDFLKTVILQYPVTPEVAVAEAYDPDTPEHARIRYSIQKINFVIGGKTQQAPTAFTINANDGTISIGTNDYTDYNGGYFDIYVKAEDYNGKPGLYDLQMHRVYVTDRFSRIRVVFNKPADAGVDEEARNMIERLNRLEEENVYYKIMSISYHVISNVQDPSFDKTDVCIVVVRDDSVMSSLSAAKRIQDTQAVQRVLDDYNVVDPGPCDPARSVYPQGWESYWWVLVAFAIFIFVCCIILIMLICVLHNQYKDYMDTRKTYLVPGQ